MSEGFVEVGRYAYRNCQTAPVMQIGMIMSDISRMPHGKGTSPDDYRDQLLGGFMAAALDAGDTETVSYIDRVCPTARKILKSTL